MDGLFSTSEIAFKKMSANTSSACWESIGKLNLQYIKENLFPCFVIFCKV